MMFFFHSDFLNTLGGEVGGCNKANKTRHGPDELAQGTDRYYISAHDVKIMYNTSDSAVWKM